MSKITNKIFKGQDHYITAKFGPREPINTVFGKTSDFHNGTDYGTNCKNIEQYAIENGTVLYAGVSKSCGNYVLINYPRLNVKMCHYHLHDLCVKTGQAVDDNTLIGHTGMTGMSTGIHLHLGVYDLNKNEYIDPEEYAKTYTEFTSEEPIKSDSTNKSLDELALEIVQGKWNVYPKRKELLENAGYNFSEVQNKVNEVMKISKEVIQGKFGVYPKRKELLEQAGYNFSVIQSIVNLMLKD